MCGRYTRIYTWRQVREFLDITVEMVPEMAPSYNVAPSQSEPICRLNEGGQRELAAATWGLMPPWATKPGPINARAETVATQPMFRSAFAKRRCVVPVSGFYEWQDTGGKVKQPWYIRRADDAPFLFAGLWEVRPDGESFAIITTAGNGFMRTIHDRMPVVLEPESIGRWLTDPDASLLIPCAEGVLTAHKVSTRVNTPRHNDPSLVEAA